MTLKLAEGCVELKTQTSSLAQKYGDEKGKQIFAKCMQK